jgi:hypothetical protein
VTELASDRDHVKPQREFSSNPRYLRAMLTISKTRGKMLYRAFSMILRISAA